MSALTYQPSPEPIATASTGATKSSWPLERVLFALAGSMTLLSALLAAVVSPWFLLLTAFVGINQWLYVVFGACPASLILGRFGLSRTCRW
jgi:Zn-dependent protease